MPSMSVQVNLDLEVVKRFEKYIEAHTKEDEKKPTWGGTVRELALESLERWEKENAED